MTEPKRRRVKVSRKAAAAPSTDISKTLTRKLKKYAELYRQVQAANAAMKDLAEGIGIAMEASACSEFHTCQADAERVKPRSNPRRTVTPEKFKAKVSEKDFLASVSITIKAAEAVLSKKEIESVVETQKAKPTKPALKITVKPIKS